MMNLASGGSRSCATAIVSAIAFLAFAANAATPAWPTATNEMRPWCYNWWMGNAVDAPGLEQQAKDLVAAGFGGFHGITIYEAKDERHPPIAYLSPEWTKSVNEADAAAQAHGLGVDLSTGCGWCFGGPWLKPEQGVWSLQRETDPKRIRKNAQVLWRGKDAKGRTVILAVYPANLQVKRAPKSGKGPMLDPLSPDAMRAHLAPFAKAFDRPGAKKPRCLYHDSFEYYGASWTPKFFEAFLAKRGYDLRDHLAALAGVGEREELERIRHDYHETVSDLILDTFTVWRDWCRERGIRTRNEAHGAPANWLDFYALADIPETEMFNKDRDILVSKFASSVAHVKGTPLVASESCTWINEHFNATLDETQVFLNQLLLAGVNHVFYHGCCYSPVDAAWPGWCFYASLEMNPRNPIWRDAPVLNAWLTRVQSLAQTSTPDEDVLVYWPIHDYWCTAEGYAQHMSVHNSFRWFAAQPVGKLSRRLYAEGVSFDYISDRQLLELAPAAKTHWKTIVVPKCRMMPKATAEALARLAKQGYRVVYEGKDPLDAVGRKEPFVATKGLAYRRFRRGNDTLYFIVANSQNDVGGEFKPSVEFQRAWTLDPMTAKIAEQAAGGQVKVKLAAGESTWLWLTPDADGDGTPSLPIRHDLGRVGVPSPTALPLDGPWTLTPICGGPDLKAGWPRTMKELSSWSRNADGTDNPFCGTVSYRTTFQWKGGGGESPVALDLGKVCNSARVWLNGKEVGARIRAPYRMEIPRRRFKQGENVLEVEVTNVGANRVRDLDQRHVQWKIFTDINIVGRDYKPFDASKWPLAESGLFGPVLITAD